jgi:hypothetical protein
VAARRIHLGTHSCRIYEHCDIVQSSYPPDGPGMQHGMSTVVSCNGSVLAAFEIGPLLQLGVTVL